MERKSPSSTLSFWLVLLLLIGTVLLTVMAFLDRLSFIYLVVPPLPVHHWLSWVGAGFIALYTPAFYFLKRRYKKSYQTLQRIHVFGNLIAFMLISIHFAEHVREYIEVIPHPGTGPSLYTAVVFMVATGFIQRFQMPRGWMKGARFIHVSSAVAFYIVVFYHILHGVGVF